MNNLFDPDTTSTNDNAFVNLLPGRHAYKIASAAVSEKGQGISFGFQNVATGKRHTHLFAVLAGGERGRIAKQDMKALWDATGLSGNPGLDRLPNFVDKVVYIEAVEKADDAGRTFANIRRIEAYDGPAPATPKLNIEKPPQEDPDDKIDTTPSSNDTTAPAAEAPATPATTPAKKWAGRKK